MPGLISETTRQIQSYQRKSEIRKKIQNGALVKDLFGTGDLTDELMMTILIELKKDMVCTTCYPSVPVIISTIGFN